MDNANLIAVKEARRLELEKLLADPVTIADNKRFAALAAEHNELRELLALHAEIFRARRELEENHSLLSASEPDLRVLAEAEVGPLETQLKKLEAELEETLHPADPLDGKSIIMEIRAGAGGDESAIFAGELFRMYSQYANAQKWKTAVLSKNVHDLGGVKEIIFEILGKKVYSRLKWESGVHRVQRVPETEKTGRIHTSTVTVAVLPKLAELDLRIDPSEIKIEITTAGGHGGQSVNTTYSAVRLVHLPTGITVSCQDERSQAQNKERALEIMRARVFDFYEEKRHREHAEARRSQIGSGDRSEKIRTYNFPQDRITDHRLNESWHNIQKIIDGDLGPILDHLKIAEKKTET